MTMSVRPIFFCVFFTSIVGLWPFSARSEEPAAAITNEDESVKWNHYDWNFMTLRLGGGLLVDTAAYDQDDASENQMELNTATKLRDMRILLKGGFKHAPNLKYTLGYMYDGAIESWRFRQTGLIYQIPDLNGEFFFGRTKEGFSTNKIMIGYDGWANERAAANDAFLPILADGIKWTGTTLGGKFVYNLGAFTNSLVQDTQSYVKNDDQVAARLVWLPFAKTGSTKLLHLAAEVRHGSSLDDHQHYRSKPESFSAQSYSVDTGKFLAESSDMLGFEMYYRPGPFMFGTEYFYNQVKSKEANDPFFHGGEIFAAYTLTGEVRPYLENVASFRAISPARSVYKGGPGAVELVLRYSYVDLDSERIKGGTFQRITPMVNWHLADDIRLEVVYGYSRLERFDLDGRTQYFQTRLQFQLL